MYAIVIFTELSMAFYLCAAAPLQSELQANVTLVSTTAANISGILSTVEEPGEADSDFKKSVHLSTALAGMVLLLFLQFHIRTHGYRLSRAFFSSSDNLMWMAMGAAGALWTTLIFLSAWVWEGQGTTTPCGNQPSSWQCAGRLAFVPWILDGVFWWWVLRYALHRARKTLKYANGTSHTSRRCLARIREVEPFNTWAEPIIVYLLIMGPVVWTSIGAIRTNLYTLGMLSLAAGIILFHSLQDYLFHLDLPHRYAMDDVRMALPTAVESGIVYVLPSRGHGFEAVYSPKLASEHADREAQRQFLEPLDSVPDSAASEGWTVQGCRNALRGLIDFRVHLIEEDKNMLSDLASWLYHHRTARGRGDAPVSESPEVQNARPTGLINGTCQRRRGADVLIGRDVAMALLLWESLVFHRRYELENMSLRDQVWALRDRKYWGPNSVEEQGAEILPASGRLPLTAGTFDETKPYGGLMDAVEEVYRLLGTPREAQVLSGQKGKREIASEMPYDYSAHARIEMERLFVKLNSSSPLPARSVVLGEIARHMTMEEYATAVWRECWRTYPSTFGALSLWTTVWYFDVGNDSGLHTTPLVPDGEFKGYLSDGPDYMTGWRMQWRHTWHTAIICQLVIMLPTVISAFFSVMAM